MNKTKNDTDEILDELTSIEYDDDDALTLLDDEESSVANVASIDDDLASFYQEETPKPKVEVEPVKKEVVSTPEVMVEKIELKKEEPVPTPIIKTEPRSGNVDDYLSKSMENRINRGNISTSNVPNVRVVEEKKIEIPVPPLRSVDPAPSKPVSSTPVHTTSEPENLSQLFAKVSNNVKGASDIVNKNVEIRRQIDEKYKELQKLQLEHEAKTKKDYAEIEAYKDDVYNKLKERKAEIDQGMVLLSREKEEFEKAKLTFETEKASHMAALKQKEQEINQSYQERLKSIEQIENGLIRRKEQLDKERAAIQLDRQQCEKDKKELAENLVKFNKLVDDFTQGVDRFNETN